MWFWKLFLFFFFFLPFDSTLFVMAASANLGSIVPPVARREETSQEVHGVTWTDHYAWLRQDGEVDREEILEYLTAENGYTEAMTEHLKPLQEALFQEFKGRIRETDDSVPYRYGGYLYYARVVKDEQYRVYCRKPFHAEGVAAADGCDSVEEVLLDVNRLAREGGHGFLTVGAGAVSEDGSKYAYSTDVKGDETFTIFVKDLATGQLLPDVITGAGYDLEWANDSSAFFYTLLDEQHQPNRVMRHVLGQDPSSDTLFYTEADQEYSLELSKCRSNHFLLISVSSAETSEVWYLPADHPEPANLKVVQERMEGVLYEVSHHPHPWAEDGAAFFIVTNYQDAVDFQLMICSLDDTSASAWKPWLPPVLGRRVEDIAVFQSHLVVSVRQHALLQLAVVPLPLNQGQLADLQLVQWDSDIFLARLKTNPEFSLGAIQVEYITPVAPLQTLLLDLSPPHHRTVLKVQTLPCGYDASRYAARRIWVPSSTTSSVSIPVTLISRADLPAGTPGPLILYGYGSYEVVIDPVFDAKRISYLDRGISFAIAHIRGGGEMVCSS